MYALDTPNGAEVPKTYIAAGETWQSEAMFVPRGANKVSFEIRAHSLSGPLAALTLKIRQGNQSSVLPLVDRGVTSPTALASVLTTEETAIMVDDVVGNFVQLEIVNAGGPCEILIVAAAR